MGKMVKRGELSGHIDAICLIFSMFRDKETITEHST